MRHGRFGFCSAAILFLTHIDIWQHEYFSNWFARVDKTKDEQPHWVTPLATTTPRLEEEYRYDQLWQMNPKGVATDTYDGEKAWNGFHWRKSKSF